MITELFSSIGASFSSPNPHSTSVNLPQPLTIIRAAWQDSSLPEKMLKVGGIKTKDARLVRIWINSLEWVAILTIAHLQAVKPVFF